ncbi:HTR-like protein [Halorubrum saccharovorum DSM 1137]|uniref:histidine kinase n=1 Tax=Halorubrum saccharovorum DSM 1137 TaxID=1227484 RepID=M0DW79_9EURY|nr:PAS domain S-box protein [Halorubrum saccharovorum]ELZ39053.1 HTR-like protein [Halorubrum saccharovorum DSM 1137]
MTGDVGGRPGSPLRPDTQPIEILHVDDDPGFVDLVATFLEREHDAFTVRTETDPRDALAVLEAEDCSVDCVVSDYDMPGLDGLTVLERVRDAHTDLPFILFTGKGSEEIASEAITAGVTDYLQKAGGTEQYSVLANRIRNAVGGYRAERYLNRGIEAIETAQDGISILNEDGRVEYANAACAEILGYPREELIGLHWETFYRDDDVDDVYDELLPEARDGRWRGTTTFVRKRGDELDIEHTLSYTADGSLICTLSPQAADAAASNLSVKEQAIDEAPVGILLTDPHQDDNPIIYANDEFTDLTGYEKREIVGRNCRFLQGEATEDEPVQRLRTAIDNREPVTVELRNYRKDGTEFWNRVRVAPLFDDDGEVDLFVGFQDDVTDRKRYEQQLRSNSARLEALFEHSPDMFAVHDIDGEIRDVNQRLCDELGYTEAELLGRNVWDIDPTADPDRASSFWDTLPPNTPHRFEGELERKDGSTFPIEVHLIRLNLDGEDRFVAMDRDISDQKRRERDLVQQNERLDRFTSVVSHDLRNPLRVAEGRLELLREDCDSDHVDDIDHALDRMDTLIEDLLTLAQTGAEAMTLQSIQLSDLVETSWGALSTADATVTVETDRTVEADRDQLQQLLTNLFRNAVEHGGPAVTVTVGDTADGFYVADDGVGFPESAGESVFDAGYTTADDGSGFGLSIVEEVASRHDWTVTAANGARGGARFDISIE